MNIAVSPWGEDASSYSSLKTTQVLFAHGPGAPGVCREPAPPLGGFLPILGVELCVSLLQPHHPLGPCSNSGDQRDFTVPGPLQGALSKGVSWSQIKMSFYWRSASFKECRIYLSGCWLLATCCYLSIPLSSCFLVWFGPNSPSPDLSLT